MRLPRFIHKWYAFIFGYFWIPCPICRQAFGGHEWTNQVHIERPIGLGEGICNNCADRFQSKFDKDVVVAVAPQTLEVYDTGWRRL